MNNQKGFAVKGFTIIELIVVIAIIAVLAAIVMVNVTQYISKAKDAAISGDMGSMSTDAAVYFASNSVSDSSGLCADTVSGFSTAYAAAQTQKPSSGTARCNGTAADSGSTLWAAEIPLNVKPNGFTCATSNGFWCIDSTSTAGPRCTDIGSGTGTSNTVCPAT